MVHSQQRVLREIRDFILQRGYPPTSKELGEILGIASATAHEQIGHLVRKGVLHRQPRKARGLTILRDPDEEPADLVSIPLLGRIAAGTPLLAEENVLGQLKVDQKVASTGRCFALRVNGDSMQNAAIRDQDTVIVRQQPVAENGDIVVAMRNGEATVKRLSICGHEIELRPENPDYEPIPINPDDDFRILGKVVGVQRNEIPNAKLKAGM